MQKHIGLSEDPAGAQGQSSIGKKTWCVDGVQKSLNQNLPIVSLDTHHYRVS